MHTNAFVIIWRTFSKYRLHLAALVALGFVGAVLEGIGINAIIPLFSFLNGGTPTDPISLGLMKVFSFFGITFKFRYVLVLVIFLFLFRAAAVVLFGYMRGWITASFVSAESGAMLDATLSASWPYLLKQKLGHVHAALVRDVQRASSLLESLSQSIQSWTGAVIYFAIAVSISPRITIYTLLAGGVLLFLVRPFLKSTRRVGATLSETEKNISQFISEHVIGMKTVKTAGVARETSAAGSKLFASMRGFYVRLMLVRSLGSGLFQPFSVVFVLILFALMYDTPGFSLVSFAATLYLIQKIFTYLESGQASLHGVSELVPYVQDLQDFKKELMGHRENTASGTKPFAFFDALAFEGVSLSYGQEREVLHDLRFSIAQGSMVGFIGPSGAGKTTVADLMLRLFEPTEGKITLDGVPAQEIRLEDWRRHMGYVAQDVFLLNATIEENIRFYREDIAWEDIERAAKQANIYDHIMSLPEGFNTIAGDRGVMLSGGQRQRIALARALASRPSVLILDEATSALDHESEALIHQAIEALHGSVTVVLIAHRPSTILGADRIIVLEGGRVSEEGTPAQLLKRPDSYFARMRNS